jgi:hypothetical protein
MFRNTIIIIQFFIICVPNQQLQGQLETNRVQILVITLRTNVS